MSEFDERLARHYEAVRSGMGANPYHTRKEVIERIDSTNLPWGLVWEWFVLGQQAHEAAERRGYEQRKSHEANLRRQGYDEEYIRTH